MRTNMTGVATRAVTGLAAVALLAGCATKGALRRAMDEQRTALATERSERAAADSLFERDLAGVRTDVNGVRTDLAALRNDLQALRTEFGAKITAMESGMQFAMPVNFGFDDSRVRSTDEAALARFATVAQKYYPGSTITVEGFADPAGSANYNLALSRRRAESVKTYLVTRGLSDQHVRTVAYGEARPVVPGAARDDWGAESNRRVVFVVESKGETPVAMALPEQH